MASNPPKVFVSYSHDSRSHKDWVRKLATDLRKNGVDVSLDQWDLPPGGDAAQFMEQGLSESDRVIIVCSKSYVRKADAGKGGVGYEKMIVTAELVNNLTSKKFIPILRNSGSQKTPKFLGYRIYIDFDNDAVYESSLESLLREIHGVPIEPKPPIGKNPFEHEILSSEEVQRRAFDETIVQAHTKTDEPSHNQLRAQLKKLLMDQSKLIALHELIVLRADQLCDGLTEASHFDPAPHFSKPLFQKRIAAYEEATEILTDLFATGCYWAKSEQQRVFSDALTRVLEIPSSQEAFNEAWLHVARYPTLRLFYAGGIAALANDSFDGFLNLATKAKGKPWPHEKVQSPAIYVLFSDVAFTKDYWKWLPGRDRHYFPVSDFLEESLRKPLRQFLRTDDVYTAAFDQFEFFVSLLYGHLHGENSWGFWAPLGSYIWRRRELFETTRSDIEEQRMDWPPLKSGLFGDSIQEVQEVLGKLQDFVTRVRRQMRIFY